MPEASGLTPGMLYGNFRRPTTRVWRLRGPPQGVAMNGRLRDRVEAEAQRLLRDRVARLRQALEGALGALAEPIKFPLTPGEWGAAEGAAQLQSVRDAADAIARAGSQREILTAL